MPTTVPPSDLSHTRSVIDRLDVRNGRAIRRIPLAGRTIRQEQRSRESHRQRKPVHSHFSFALLIKSNAATSAARASEIETQCGNLEAQVHLNETSPAEVGRGMNGPLSYPAGAIARLNGTRHCRSSFGHSRQRMISSWRRSGSAFMHPVSS